MKFLYRKINEKEYNNTLNIYLKLLCACRSKKPKPKPKPGKPAPKPAAKPKLSLFEEEDDPDKELFQPALKSSECDFWIVLHHKCTN